MHQPLTYNNLHNHLVSKLFKRKIVKNINKWCKVKRGHALVYYKTEPFIPFFRHNHTHSNIWMIQCLVRVLNLLGFWVDLVDRSIDTDYTPENKYDVFIGLGGDNSGRHFSKFAHKLSNAKIILLTTGAHPNQRNSQLQKRQDLFLKRHGKTALKQYRHVSNSDISNALKITDDIWCIGNKITRDTYSKYFAKPIRLINPSSSPKLRLDRPAIDHKKATNFLFFSGSGNLLKGLDLLFEVFFTLPELTLNVCTVLETETNKFYKQQLDRSPNIRIHGFTMTSSKKFQYLTKKSAYIILPSCSEGLATSVTTCMRRGCIPIVTPETGISTNMAGYSINDMSISGLTNLVKKLSVIKPPELTRQIHRSYIESFNYTQEAHEQSVMNAALYSLPGL